MTLVELANENEGVAAWVAALGSVFALAIAGIAVWNEARLARAEIQRSGRRDKEAQERDDQHRAARLGSLRVAAMELIRHGAFVAAHALETASDCHDQVVLSRICLELAADFEGVEKQLLAFPVYDLESAEAVRICARTQMIAGAARTLLLQVSARASDTRWTTLTRTATGPLEDHKGTLEELVGQMADLMDKL